MATTASSPRPVKLRQVPAARGALWARQGFTLFSRKPLAFSALLATFLFGALVLLMVPLIGPLLLLASLPLVSLGFMIASHVTAHGQVPTPLVFVAPLRRDRPRVSALLKLCGLYALATVAVLMLSEWIDGGRFAELQDLMSTGEADPEKVAPLLSDPRLVWGLIARLSLTTLLSVPFWHAPALLHWGRQGPAQALFSSTLACWRNRGAFLVYAFTWTGLILGFLTISSLVFGLLGTPQLVTLLAMPVVMLFTTVFYASLFFTFIDCFEIAPATPTPASASDAT